MKGVAEGGEGAFCFECCADGYLLVRREKNAVGGEGGDVDCYVGCLGAMDCCLFVGVCITGFGRFDPKCIILVASIFLCARNTHITARLLLLLIQNMHNLALDTLPARVIQRKQGKPVIQVLNLRHNATKINESYGVIEVKVDILDLEAGFTAQGVDVCGGEFDPFVVGWGGAEAVGWVELVLCILRASWRGVVGHVMVVMLLLLSWVSKDDTERSWALKCVVT